jgi:hypothetical protein
LPALQVFRGVIGEGSARYNAPSRGGAPVDNKSKSRVITGRGQDKGTGAFQLFFFAACLRRFTSYYRERDAAVPEVA